MRSIVAFNTVHSQLLKYSVPRIWRELRGNVGMPIQSILDLENDAAEVGEWQKLQMKLLGWLSKSAKA